MEVLVLCDEGIKITNNIKKELTALSTTNTLVAIKEKHNSKQLLYVLTELGIGFREIGSRDESIHTLKDDLIVRYDKVVIISNIGKTTIKYIDNYNVEVWLDSGAIMTTTIYDNDDVDDIDLQIRNPLGITMASNSLEINGVLNSKTKLNIIKILYGRKIIVNPIKNRVNGGSILYNSLLSKGIRLFLDGDIKINDDTNGVLNIHPLLGYILNNNLTPDSKHTMRAILEPDTLLLKQLLITNGIINKATSLIAKHINNKIVLVTDSDADGLCSAALGYRYFKDYLNKEVIVITNERRFGNGVNDEMIKRILDINGVRLIITSDHGTNDNDRYKKLKDVGIDVLVTDHHEISRTTKKDNMDGFVNCIDPYSGIPPYISGCAVMYVVLLNHYNSTRKDINYLLNLMPYIGISTISDVMPLDKPLNRLFYNLGKDIMSNDTIPFMKALDLRDINPLKLSFNLITYINACNRMGDSRKGYEFLIADNIHQAEIIYKDLKKLNTKKKSIVKEALKHCTYIKKKNFVICEIETGYDGVLGIVSSRLVNKYNKLIITIEKFGDVYKGSARCDASNVHIAKVLSLINDKDDSILISYGGHKGAGGLSIHSNKLTDFVTAMGSVLPETLTNEKPAAVRIHNKDLNNNLYHLISKLEPYGNGFNKPVFEIEGTIIYLKKSYNTLMVIKDSDGNTVTVTSYLDKGYAKGDRVVMNVVFTNVREIQLEEI